MTTAEPPGARYVLSVSAADVGARVVVRHRLAEGGVTDVLGELLRWDDEVAVRDRSGAVRTVPRDGVVAAKRVPPAPPPGRARR